MSGVRTHFWHEVARRKGGVCWPRKYGLNGCIPALTSNRVGSSATRLADGTTVCPRCSKYLRKRRTISAASITAILHLDMPALRPARDFGLISAREDPAGRRRTTCGRADFRAYGPI